MTLSIEREIDYYLDSIPEAQAVHAVDEAKEEAHGGGCEAAADEGVLLSRLEQAGVLTYLDKQSQFNLISAELSSF